MPAAGWSAITEPATGGTTAASPAPPPSWSAPALASAGPAYATPAPNPPTKSTPPSINSCGTWSAPSQAGAHNDPPWQFVILLANHSAKMHDVAFLNPEKRTNYA